MMNIGAMTPVLARIAVIESQFAAQWPSTRPAVSSFVEVLDSAQAAADAPLDTTNDVAAVTPYASSFFDSGAQHGVPPQLLAAVGFVESFYQPDVVSPRGAVGLMQLMPQIAESLGVDPRDPKSAIDGAARLLADHEQRFGSWELALAAYFSGAQAVEDAGRVPPTPQSSAYVNNVMERMGMS